MHQLINDLRAEQKSSTCVNFGSMDIKDGKTGKVEAHPVIVVSSNDCTNAELLEIKTRCAGISCNVHGDENDNAVFEVNFVGKCAKANPQDETEFENIFSCSFLLPDEEALLSWQNIFASANCKPFAVMLRVGWRMLKLVCTGDGMVCDWDTELFEYH